MIISVDLDEASSKQKASAILKQHKVTWRRANLGGGLDNPLLRRFQRADQKSLPMFVLIGSDRISRYSGWGGEEQSDLLASIKTLMGN